jgi:hypothetical protein
MEVTGNIAFSGGIFKNRLAPDFEKFLLTDFQNSWKGRQV